MRSSLKLRGIESRALLASISLHLILFISMPLVWQKDVSYNKVSSIEAATVTLLELPKVEEKVIIPKPKKPKLTEEPIKVNPQIKPPEQLPKVEGHFVAYKNLGETLLSEPMRSRSRSPGLTSSETLLELTPMRKRNEARELEGSIDSIKTQTAISSDSLDLPTPRLSISTNDKTVSGRASSYPSASQAQIVMPPERKILKETLPQSPGFTITGEVAGRQIVYRPPKPEVKSADSGQVGLRFWVAPDGRVHKVIINKKSGSPYLDRLATEYWGKYIFEELDKRAEQRDQWGDVAIDFTRLKG